MISKIKLEAYKKLLESKAYVLYKKDKKYNSQQIIPDEYRKLILKELKDGESNGESNESIED